MLQQVPRHCIGLCTMHPHPRTLRGGAKQGRAGRAGPACSLLCRQARLRLPGLGAGAPVEQKDARHRLPRRLLPAPTPTRRAPSPLTPACGCIHSSVCAYFRLALEEALSRTRAGRASSSPVMGPVFGTCTTVGSAPPSCCCHSPPPDTSCVTGQLSVHGFTSTPHCMRSNAGQCSRPARTCCAAPGARQGTPPHLDVAQEALVPPLQQARNQCLIPKHL